MPSSNRTGSRPAILALAAVAATAADPAAAYPDASPWGAANPTDEETCGSCHYDHEPVRDSAAIRLAGLPETARPGDVYELRVHMSGVDAAVSGFQLVATAGEFRSRDDSLQSTGNAIRSTRVAAIGTGVAWALSWRAPERGSKPVEIFLAMAASNDDQSPFGETIHYRRFVVGLEPRDTGSE